MTPRRIGWFLSLQDVLLTTTAHIADGPITGKDLAEEDVYNEKTRRYCTRQVQAGSVRVEKEKKHQSASMMTIRTKGVEGHC